MCAAPPRNCFRIIKLRFAFNSDALADEPGEEVRVDDELTPLGVKGSREPGRCDLGDGKSSCL